MKLLECTEPKKTICACAPSRMHRMTHRAAQRHGGLPHGLRPDQPDHQLALGRQRQPAQALKMEAIAQLDYSPRAHWVGDLGRWVFWKQGSSADMLQSRRVLLKQLCNVGPEGLRNS